MRVLIASLIVGTVMASNPQWASAESLTPESYVELTRELLRLSLDSWQNGAAAPNAAVEAAFAEHCACTRDQYSAYMSAHHREVSAYLETRPGLKAEIEALATRVRELIEEAERRQ